MSQALYRKYRPRKLSEVVGQEHVTDVLDKAIKAGKISHAYLLTGLRGTGKTSIARILAHEVNGLTYDDDDTTHLDIIEIDAASNRRIDEIRDLRDKVHIAPTSAKYKVYIIDEVHMLTKEAFNALLKTLEEPPAHCIFILATTELHKVPETIISRTQRYSLKPGDTTKVIDHLRAVATKEHVKITDDALMLIARHGRGSFRDSMSLLDQVATQTKSEITLDEVQEMLGMARGDLLDRIQRSIFEGTPADVMQTLEEINESGLSATQLSKQLIDSIHDLLLAQSTEPHRLLSLIDDLMGVASATNPQLKLEMILLRANLDSNGIHDIAPKPLPNTPPQPTSTPKPAPVENQAKPMPQNLPEAPTNEASEPSRDPDEPEAVIQPHEHSDTDATPLDKTAWQNILKYIKEHSPSLTASLRMASPHLSGNTLQLKFAQSFHQKRNANPKVKDILIEAVQSVMGKAFQIESVFEKGVEPLLGAIDLTKDLAPLPVDLAPASNRDTTPAATPIPDNAKSVMDLFGGGEVV